MNTNFTSLSLLLILFACKPQKSVVEYKHTTDTLIVSKTHTIYQPVNDTTYIESPCDSLGILNRFYTKIAIPFGQVIVKSDKGRIKAIVATNQIVNKSDSTYSKHNQYQTITKETIKYRIPSWAIYTIILESIIILGYLYFKFFVKL